jgi:hypothetical protein
LAGLRLDPEDARLVDAVHHLGDVLMAHVKQMVPVLEALGRPTAVLREQLAPVFQRFLLAAELAIDRDVVNLGVNRMLVRMQPTKLECAFVIALQVVIIVHCYLIPTDCSVSVQCVRLLH